MICDSMHKGLDERFEHSVSIDPFKDTHVDEREVDTSYRTDVIMAFEFDKVSTSESIRSMKQIQPSIEGYMLMIVKPVEVGKEYAI